MPVKKKNPNPPSNGASQTPSDGASQTPSDGASQTPSDGASQTPSNGASQTPSIRIRMYRVGFGDCFLVTLAGAHHILVDCGVHNTGHIKAGGEDLLQKAFENIQQVTGKKLAIIIATHAHQDHVSGYGTFAGQFKDFEIGEVWMPWTEAPSDATARQFRAKREALVGLLRTRLTAAGDAQAAAAVDNATANPAAMQALHSGFGKGKPRYLKAGDTLDAPAGLTGFSARILGPPQDTSFIRKLNPPGSDHYLRMAVAAAKGKTVNPFPDWNLAEARLLRDWPRLDAKLIGLISAADEFPAAAVAFSLDKLLNNTSIVALFTFAGKHMLFPGDAQYGDWSYWYKKTGAEVLSDICFYKVSHHGSMNATPKGALEEMPQGKFAAMASTQSKPFPSIPQPNLITAIGERTAGAFVRSDSIPVAGAVAGPPLGALPADFTEGQESQGEYWFDYTIA